MVAQFGKHGGFGEDLPGARPTFAGCTGCKSDWNPTPGASGAQNRVSSWMHYTGCSGTHELIWFIFPNVVISRLMKTVSWMRFDTKNVFCYCSWKVKSKQFSLLLTKQYKHPESVTRSNPTRWKPRWEKKRSKSLTLFDPVNFKMIKFSCEISNPVKFSSHRFDPVKNNRFFSPFFPGPFFF